MLISFLLIMTATFVNAQDYTMYETHYLTPIAGHEQAITEEIIEHNKLYHANGPYTNYVFNILSGPRTGDFLFAMGSCTFTQLDGRPSGHAHDQDWASVILHSHGISNVEYWKRVDNLSTNIPGAGDKLKPLSRVRFFEVSDNSDFRDLQDKFMKVTVEMGNKRPRIMYQNHFNNKEGRDWALVTHYDSWAELDGGKSGEFKTTYIKLYGEDAWKELGEKYDKTVLSREDEMRVRVLPPMVDKK